MKFNKVYIDKELALSVGMADEVVLQNEDMVTQKGAVLLRTNRNQQMKEDNVQFSIMLVLSGKDMDDDIYCALFEINEDGKIIDWPYDDRDETASKFMINSAYLNPKIYRERVIKIGDIKLSSELNDDFIYDEIIPKLTKFIDSIIENRDKEQRYKKIQEKTK